ncbi:MAG: hypothetical protein E6P95_03990 [Candidatus Moraniibacteriota bacterium]|nr:MAG: hypothetical protein E6P95_03990 [Candidatus Moranbacteria bacterium]
MNEVSEKPQALSPAEVVKAWGQKSLIGLMRVPGKPVQPIAPLPQRSEISAKIEQLQFRVTVIRLHKPGFCKFKNVMMDIGHEVSVPLLLEAVKNGRAQWVTLRLTGNNMLGKPAVKLLSVERKSLQLALQELGYM